MAKKKMRSMRSAEDRREKQNTTGRNSTKTRPQRPDAAKGTSGSGPQTKRQRTGSRRNP